MPVFLGCLLWLSCQPQESPLRIAVAANLYPTLKQIVAAYPHSEGIELIPASSGVLTAQIQQGAPYQLFLSANEKYTRHLEAAGFASSPPTPFAYGKLALWMKEPCSENLSPSLLDPQIKSLAIAQPKLAPFGLAAEQWLQHQGWWEALQAKLVYGENIGQVNHYINIRAVDAALTAYSARWALAVSDGCWLVVETDSSKTVLLSQVSQLLKSATEKARDFQEFLQGDRAQAIFARMGYAPL